MQLKGAPSTTDMSCYDCRIARITFTKSTMQTMAKAGLKREENVSNTVCTVHISYSVSDGTNQKFRLEDYKKQDTIQKFYLVTIKAYKY